MVYLLVFIVSFVSFSLKKEKANQPLTVYKWEEVYFKSDFRANNRFIDLEGNGYYKTKNEKAWIIAFDTLPVTIKVVELTNDSIQLIEKLNYKAQYNPDFHKAWDTLELGEIPTPLNKKEAEAFRDYSDFKLYRLLGQKSPEFSVQSVYGESFTEDSLLNKVTLINFWFHGCLPCMAEIPALNEVADYYKNHPKVQLLSFFLDSIYIDEVGIPRYQSKAMSITDGKIRKGKYEPVNFNFTQIPNSKKKCDVFNIIAFPTNLIIDQNGIIQEIFMGANGDIKENNYLKNNLTHKIDRLLNEVNK